MRQAPGCCGQASVTSQAQAKLFAAGRDSGEGLRDGLARAKRFAAVCHPAVSANEYLQCKGVVLSDHPCGIGDGGLGTTKRAQPASDKTNVGAQRAARVIPDVGHDFSHAAVGHSEPAGQGGGILINAHRRNQAALADVVGAIAHN